jgi:uncharacterized protein
MMKLQELSEILAVCRLDPQTEFPSWALKSPFFSITKTADELSVVCEHSAVPASVKAETDWRAFRVVGTLDFSLTGILSAIANPLAQEKISLFAISTFDTDYVLIKSATWESAKQALRAAGFSIQ